MNDFNDDINTAVTTLRNGGIILYPTDTIWGLGCDATNDEAVEKIFSIKARDESKSLIVLVNSEQMLERYVDSIPAIAYELVLVANGPLTIIYPEGKNMAKGVCAADGSVGIRICSDEFCRQLLARLRKPLVSTSANFSGKPSPEFFGDIESDLVNMVDYSVKYRQNDRRKNVPSPVIKLNSDGTIRIVRH
ncbi:MAG: threonylcarbamoyl-AMP synthase [Bacteroidales bacterium]|jgi:L-threonylcarbamoyladenylate synthase|nr:threonylcarbamoyl-AMP synthase [Bacteroidales bacterium]